MSAIPKIYSDAACTQELAKDGSNNYVISLGPDTGLDGNVGDSTVKQLWLKNTGNEIYQSVTLTESGDTNNRASFSLDNASFNAGTLSFGDIAVNASKTFYVKITVEAQATAGRYNFTFQLSGESI